MVIGAGSVGLAIAAVLQAYGIKFDVIARHKTQQSAAVRLGATLDVSDGYDLVLDAVGNEMSMQDALARVKPRGRVGLVGTFFEPTPVSSAISVKEVDLIGALFYRCSGTERAFDEAARLLFENPHIGDVMISHRFPLDAAEEAFDIARDRASGALKCVLIFHRPRHNSRKAKNRARGFL